ncbi:hypothetical protein [Mycobacterium hubeiense]|uniref:hypothetical protein n=1 Tax=Mycobacterium hubeiense TaxID=1867256 RepID=UPI001303FF46|nr:hypothetical protein [Mycobacterium sp. QGD 101]
MHDGLTVDDQGVHADINGDFDVMPLIVELGGGQLVTGIVWISRDAVSVETEIELDRSAG